MADEKRNIYLAINGEKYGPVSKKDIKRLYKENKITGTEKYVRAGMSEWRPLPESGILSDKDGLPPLELDPSELWQRRKEESEESSRKIMLGQIIYMIVGVCAVIAFFVWVLNR